MFILDYEISSSTLNLRTSDGLIRLVAYSAHIIRITYTRRPEFSHQPSLAVCAKPDGSSPWKTREDEHFIHCMMGELTIRILKRTGAFSYFDSEGRLLTREPDGGGKTLEEIDVYRYTSGSQLDVELVDSVDGVKVKAQQFEKEFDRKAYHTKLEFQWAEGEALYGLGSHEEGVLNLRGTHQYLYQENMKVAVPVLVSTRGYGILVDSYSLITFHDDLHGSYLWTDVDDELDYYFMYGPQLDDVVKRYRFLTGRVPMLPKWAFGYVQSKERYISQDELLEIAKEYRRRRIPLDCLVLDWQSWPGRLWGQKSLDPSRFPDPGELMNRLHGMGVHLMISVWPNMTNDGPNQIEMRQSGFLLANDSTYDAFSVSARELYWKQARDGLFKHGVDAWWCDCTEPFEADWKGEVKPEPEIRMQNNVDEAKRYIDPAYINAYSLQHSRGLYEGQRETTQEKRVVNLTRSAYAGQQRYSTITWSGDTSASWQTLHRQIAAGLNFCATGIPYWTMDIGAFFVKRRPELWFWNGQYDEDCQDPAYRELYTRWFQFGTFLPLTRSHGTDCPREVWRFGEPGTPFYDTLVRFIQLRYRLLPYIYSLAGWVTNNDYTMLRLLAFDFAMDERVHGVDDQFMFGPSLMACPVTHPMRSGNDSDMIGEKVPVRSVYLPGGADWYDFWTGERLEGGQHISTAAPIEIMPLFVRAGSIIPMGPIVDHTGLAQDEELELRIYLGGSCSFELYQDSGDGYEYENGEFRTISITWDDPSRTLTFSDERGSFPGMRKETRFRIVMVSEATGRGLETSSISEATIRYTGTKLVCQVAD